MNNKSTIIIVVAAIIVVIAAAGGYFMGKGSGNGSSKSVYSNTTSSRPALNDNKASLIADLEARLREKPDDEKAIYSLADTYFSLKRFDEAIGYYKKLLTLTPDNTDVYNDLGLSLHYLGKSREAVSALEDGIKKNPYNQRIWLTKGFVLAYGIGDLTKAGEAWKKARGIDPASSVGKAADNYLTQINKIAAGEKKADK
ncbi:MAG: tetratricopeptide repeat protein [Thermodesulfobacteriota bacterium]